MITVNDFHSAGSDKILFFRAEIDGQTLSFARLIDNKVWMQIPPGYEGFAMTQVPDSMVDALENALSNYIAMKRKDSTPK